MKKRYEKPSMKVYELQRHAPLICTSGTDPDYWGYAPGTVEGEKHLA